MNNVVFWKAMRLLSHPVSLSAMVLLLVNDHLLRRVWPSWATGKAGDLAWLYFAPFVAAAILAWLVPLRVQRRGKAIELLAFGLTGAVFALTKALPSVHAWLVQTVEEFFGLSIALRRDPTDLIALVALGFSWWMWNRHCAGQGPVRAAGWAALPFAVLLTVANSTAPNVGVECLAIDDEKVLAYTAYETFVSEDGGLSWTDGSLTQAECTYAETGPNLEQAASDTEDWRFAIKTPASQAERAFYEKTRGGNAYFEPGPLDVITDPATGNVIIAMGHEGALVRTPDGEWRWTEVGENRRENLDSPSDILSLLSGEAVLSFFFGLLSISTLALRINRSWFRVGFLAAAWGMWGMVGILFPPALTTGYGSFILATGLLASAVIIVGLALFSAFRAYQQNPNLLVQLAAIAIVGTLAVFLPFALWAHDYLPNYTAAVLFATLFGGITLFVGDRWLRRNLLARETYVAIEDAGAGNDEEQL